MKSQKFSPFLTLLVSSFALVACTRQCGATPEVSNELAPTELTPGGAQAPPMSAAVPEILPSESPVLEEPTEMLPSGELLASAKGMFLIRISWESGPQTLTVGNTVARIQLLSEQGTVQADLGEVKASVMRPDEAPVSLQVNRDATSLNTYMITGFPFTSVGSWTLQVEAGLKGNSDSVTLPIQISQ